MTSSLTRRAFAALGLAATVSLVAAPAFAQTPADLKKKGEINVGLLVDFPPYGTTNAQNQPDGYDADVARLLGKDWGVKVNLVPVTGPNRIPYLLTGKVDLLIASLAITPERAKQVQFSKPYSAASIVLLAPKKDAIKGPADIKSLRIGVARASTQDIALTQVAPKGTEIRRFDDDASAMQALISGQVDAIGCATTVAAVINKREPGKYEPKFVLKQQDMAVALRPGQTELLKAVNEFVEKNTKNGELNKLYHKWLDTDLPKML
jgi:polar amino acid transport system substrate-binding protein